MYRTALTILLLLGTAARGAEPSRDVDYASRIKPLLAAKCYACHGALKQRSGLRLETRTLMLRGGDDGASIVPGKSADSPLLQRISADNEERMPPESEGPALTADEVALIRKWIDQGAKAPEEPVPAAAKDHWAFQLIVRPAVPKISNARWGANPIDAFIARRHQSNGLTAQDEAPRIILLRRLYLDLIGVPPTTEEIVACQSDQSADWYTRTVERLLKDRRHGERWARHWMDIWRYSDWWGLGAQLRNSQKHIWHWRDWIVESLNDDSPYDEMVRLMLAADELHPNDLSKLRATGFLARNFFVFNRAPWMEETVEHVSKGFLGLTMNCAKCHDHKYDPIEQSDFYRMRAFFEPYHVRIDVVPGETDLARDGIPRAFDGLPKRPTYRYIRGNERNPDKSKIIKPGVPKLLAFAELKITPIVLPVEAWQPGRRQWVADAYRAIARQKVEAAKAEFASATAALATAKRLAAGKPKKKTAAKQKPAKVASSVILTEDFKTLDKQRWQLFAGQWVHQAGKLEQKKDGASRAVLRWTAKPPRDFEAQVRFTILGGSKWRSVGLSFDAAEGDPTQETNAAYHEQNVYVSGYAGGSKVQVAYNDRGKWHYPQGPALRSMPIALNREHTLRVRVRGTLVNVSLNGQPVIAYRTPLARRNGSMQLMTFDALAEFHEIKIGALAKGAALRPANAAAPSPAVAPTDVAYATASLKVAETHVDAVHAELVSIESRAAAMRADEPEKRSKTVAAVKAERQIVAAVARHAVAVAERKVLRATAGKKGAAEKALKKAQATFKAAKDAADKEVKATDLFKPFVGAKWTPTRFVNSGRDDKTIKFPSQSTGRRTALARWITDRRNPLTARVAVNHIWTRHMGRPLVPTVFDFGRNGTPPTHPELLDWLAAELIENNWSMKHLHRVIVTSAAYRMSSSKAGGEKNTAKDRDNRYWWRRIPIRLESQVVRDSILAMAGTLDPAIGGPPVPRDRQASSTRRSLYFFHSNNQRNLLLTTFDEASVKDCYRREQSIVPQQALALTNSALVLDASKKIAKRLSAASEKDTAFIRNAFAVVLGIAAGDAEISAGSKAIEAWRKLPGGSPDRARANFVWALINHNDFVTSR